jgi:hypothetical protein
VLNVARASSGTQTGKLIRLMGVLGTALLLAPPHVSDAEAGQETRLSAGRPIRVGGSLSGGDGPQSNYLRFALRRERKNVLRPQHQRGAFLSCVTVSIIYRL